MEGGFFHNPDADTEAYVFGTTSPLPLQRLQPNRNWKPYATLELQNARGYDPLDCASINTERCIQILLTRRYGIEVNYSERWLAWATGTGAKGGNDPHFVAEFIRKNGIPLESEWLSDVPQERFYDTPPAESWDWAKDFLNRWDFKHDTVRGLDAMWDALQDSPLGCSVGWNTVDPATGYWYKNGDAPDSHWSVVCVGGEYGKYWEFLDSAEPTVKRVRWDIKPQLVKRYTISKRLPTVEEANAIIKILTWIRDWWLANLRGPVPMPPEPQKEPATPPITIQPTPQPPVATDLTEELYSVAKAAIGKDVSPRDRASDDVACAESLSMIIGQIMPFDTILSTAILDKVIAADPRFQKTYKPVKGCIAIAPTVGTNHGHCWVLGETWAMSNTSANGKWEANYTNAGVAATAKKRGLPLHYYIPTRSNVIV